MAGTCTKLYCNINTCILIQLKISLLTLILVEFNIRIVVSGSLTFHRSGVKDTSPHPNATEKQIKHGKIVLVINVVV